MKKLMTSTLLAGVSWIGLNAAAHAQDTGPFTWEGAIEIGVESTFDSDDPTAELTDAYTSIELGGEAALSENISVFGAITIESVLDPVDDRAFEDIGLYVSELGVSFDLGPATISAGKLSPAFGTAWDATPGFFGTALAEDYELSEAIGLTAELPVGSTGGTLSFAVFYADDTALSNSIGTRRGRNSVADAGAGNTGKLNNLALQWSQEFGDTAVTIGARHLTAGQGDASDETGFVAGVSHSFGNGLDVIAEVASFEGSGGTTDDATYVTFGGSYGVGNLSYSAAFTQRDITSTGKDQLMSVGVDYAFENGMELGGGIAFLDEGGVETSTLGVALVIPLGS